MISWCLILGSYGLRFLDFITSSERDTYIHIGTYKLSFGIDILATIFYNNSLAYFNYKLQ